VTCMVITGAPGAGKSAVSEALAHRLANAVHLHGSAFRRAGLGVAWTESESGLEVPAKGTARTIGFDLAAHAADAYVQAGYNVVLQDSYLGDDLVDLVCRIESRPLYVVVLSPNTSALKLRVAARCIGRGQSVHGGGHSIDLMDHRLRRMTPHLGLWVDSSDLSLDETVELIVGQVWEHGRLADSRLEREQLAALGVYDEISLC
jgi:predicted kinase